MAPQPDTVGVGEDEEAVLRGQRLGLGAAVALLPLLGLLLAVVLLLLVVLLLTRHLVDGRYGGAF